MVATPPVSARTRHTLSPRHSEGASDIPEESLMLTGDENIIDTNFTVFCTGATPPRFCSMW
jgi:hypothetical protein